MPANVSAQVERAGVWTMNCSFGIAADVARKFSGGARLVCGRPTRSGLPQPPDESPLRALNEAAILVFGARFAVDGVLVLRPRSGIGDPLGVPRHKDSV